MIQEAGDVFNDPGVKVKNTNESFTRVGSVDDTKVGTYTLTYYVIDEDGSKSNEVFREVQVVDTTKPTFNLDATATVYGSSFNLDLVVSNVSDNASSASELIITSDYASAVNQNSSGEYTVEVTITDNDDNSSTKTIVVTYYQNEYDYVYSRAKNLGTRDVNDDGIEYYKVEYIFNSVEYIFTFYEDGDVSASLQLDSDDGSSTVYGVIYAHSSFYGLNFATIICYDEYGTLEDFGYDDDALLSKTSDHIVIFDDSTFDYYESTWETLTEGGLLLVEIALDDFYTTNLNLELE